MPQVLVYHGTPQLFPEVDGTPSVTTTTAAAGETGTGLGLGVPVPLGAVPTIIAPENKDNRVGIAAIRFAKPVRLAALRVVPTGVVHPAGVGETDATPFTAELFLNVSPSDPVNALVRTTVAVWPAEHTLEFAIDMPENTSTRLVIIRAPAKKVTMSLYAYSDGEAETAPALALSAPTPLSLPAAKDLIAAIPSLQAAPAEIRSRALATLATVARSTCLLEDVLNSGHADALLDTDGSEAAIASILGLESDDARGLGALTHLATPSTARHPSPESQVDLALQLAASQRSSPHPQAASALSITVARLANVLNLAHAEGATATGDEAQDKLLVDRLARALPPLAVHATARGAETPIPVPLDLAATVIGALLPVSADVTIDGSACGPAARLLVRPFLATLPDEARKRAWEPPSPSPSVSPAASPILGADAAPAPPPSMAMNLHRALGAPSSSLSLTPTPAEVLAVVAPTLLTALSTAPGPPLGIPPALPSGTSGSASDYAGKVYSAHEFRRERDTVSGLGIGLAGVGRKASRHVDDFRSAR